ncbi:MAG: right-handed parallel beta-helix repeat-containing protein [Clostridia bacterium]|nr:right-handed parallel beta-helix repeat-containing protein [Clostridia bacterium]
MRKGRAFFKKTACLAMCAALFLCLFSSFTAAADEENPYGTLFSDKNGLTVTENGKAFEDIRFLSAGDIRLEGVSDVTFENCFFYGVGVLLSGVKSVSFINCDFFGADTAVKIEGSENISFEGCYFTECITAIAAKGTNFGYLSSEGGSGYLKSCFFYGASRFISLEDCRDVAISGGQMCGAEVGLLLKDVSSLLVTDTPIFKCSTAISLNRVSGELESLLFYSNGYNVKSEAAGSSVKVKNSASVGSALLYPDDISFGVTQKSCTFIEEKDYKSRFTFNKEGELEGFDNTAGVRVEASGGAYNFEPDNNYIFIDRNDLFLNHRLFCKSELLFKESAELYGEINLKTVNDSPWLNGGTNNIKLSSDDGLLFTSSLFNLQTPLKHAEWKLSLEGRFSVDYLAFLPDISLTAELVDKNIIRLSLLGFSSPVFCSSPVIEVSGTSVPYKTVLTGGTEAYLVFEKDISGAARKITVSLKKGSLSEPFDSLLSGCDVVGRSPEKEAHDFSLDSVQSYREIKVFSRVTLPDTELLPVLINVGIAVAVTGITGVLLFLLFSFLSKRNQIRKFAKKGRKALKNRRRSNRF